MKSTKGSFIFFKGLTKIIERRAIPQAIIKDIIVSKKPVIKVVTKTSFTSPIPTPFVK